MTKRFASDERVTKLYRSGLSVGAVARRIGYTTTGTARKLARLGLRKLKTR